MAAETGLALGDRPYFAEDETFGVHDETDPEEDVRPQEKKQNPRNFGPRPEPKKPKPEHTGSKFKGRLVSGEFCDFRLSFFVGDVEKRAAWVAGETVTVSLLMERNTIPSRRQLKAIGKLSKNPAKKAGFKFNAMQAFLKGEGVPSPNPSERSLYEVAIETSTDAKKKNVENYLAHFNMNGPQTDVWDAIFRFRNFVTQLQGPPGTGKTRTVAIIAMTFALLKIRVTLCAPSNTTAKECLRVVIEHVKVLYEIDPEAASTFKVVYVPTSASTKESIAGLATEHLAHDFFTEGEGAGEDDPFNGFKLYTYIVKSFERRANLHLGNFDEAVAWLQILAQRRASTGVSKKHMKFFVRAGMAEVTFVLQDPAVKLVISTSSGADLLDEYGYKPDAVIIDESAFATEQDSLIALALLARFNVLVGDHEQLRPIIRSRGHNDYSRQQGVSIYERMYGNRNVPLFRLKINYRMHPSIAELPGILTYEWLGCDDSTLVLSDAYRSFSDWYYTSSQGEFYETATREPAYGGEADDDMRVRFVNPKGGFALAKLGSKSLHNYANINAAVEFVTWLLQHVPSEDDIPDIKASEITFLSPYEADLEMARQQLAWAIDGNEALGPIFQCIPEGTTIDKIQGGQNQIINIATSRCSLCSQICPESEHYDQGILNIQEL